MKGPETAPEAPATLGPYRVERLLGRGGMGEVYQGFDERLGRPVALKRIQPDAGEGESQGESRARFQREARTLARLSHGNVVQIHDWVEEGGADWLVMELVEGESLADRLRTGRLEPAEAVRIARGIVAGLAAAHRAGIVHRDLKPGNVVLTPDGEVKVLDFGLAKSYATRAESPDFSTHVVPGQLLGTVQYMSPEQALGIATDHRSDLFSFGTLLYEMLTGRLPFGGDKSVETLTRICTLVQPPAGQGRPEVPAALSRLVDHLLAKDPVRRPQRTEEVTQALDRVERVIAGGREGGDTAPVPAELLAGDLAAAATGATDATQEMTAPGWRRPEAAAPAQPALRRRRLLRVGAAVAAVLAGAGLWAWLARPPEVVPVAIPPTVVGAAGGVPEATRRLAVEAVHTGLLRALLGLKTVAVREPGSGDPVAPVALARALAAREVLTSSLDCADAVCRVQLRRVRGSDGSLLWIQTFSIPADGLLRSSALVAEVARSAWPGAASRPGLAGLAVGDGDFARFLELRRRYQQREPGTATGELLGELAALQKSSPRFLEAWLLEVTIERRIFGESREAGALERAFAALEQASRLAPDDPRTLTSAFDLDLAAGRLDAAERALARARQLQPGDSNFLAWEAALLERRGQSDKARAAMAEAARLEPSWLHLSELADMASRAGDFAAARRHLEAALARSPGRFNGLSRLAELELLHGSTERAAALYQELAARSPGDAEVMNLGVAWLLLGRYEKAVEQFRLALGRTPGSPYALLNLADAEALAGRRPVALPLYEKAAAAAASDPDPAAVLPVRAQALAQLGRAEEAVAAIQPALRAAPNNPDVLYAASLVFTLVGDQTSALWHARRAVAAGMDRRWFTLPWFRDLLRRLDAAPRPGP